MSTPDAFYKYYLHWSTPAREAYEKGLGLGEELDIDPSNIVFCGMGGSGAAGLYASHILLEVSNKPAVPAFYYKPPSFTGKETLVFALSFSGNTLETLKCARSSLERGSTLIAVTRGGKLGELAEKEERIQKIIVPEAPAPRAGFPGLFYSVLGVLVGLGIIDPERIGVEESFHMLENERGSAGGEAERLSSWLSSSEEPVIVVSGYSLYPVIIRLKNELAENAKLASIIGFFPESGHNDIEAWSRLRGSRMLIVESDDDLEQVMIDAALTLVEPSSTIILPLKGESLLEKLIWPTWVGGLASVDAAIKLNRDPLTIGLISAYKRAWTSVINKKD